MDLSLDTCMLESKHAFSKRTADFYIVRKKVNQFKLYDWGKLRNLKCYMLFN